MGYDSDHPASEGEVGKCGVAIDSLEDMEIFLRHRSGKDHRIDDHQFARIRVMGNVSGGSRETRRGLAKRFRARFKTTF